MSTYYPEWGGEDGAIINCAKEIDYPIKRVRKPLYTLLNPTKDKSFFYNDNIPTWKRIIRLVSWGDH